MLSLFLLPFQYRCFQNIRRYVIACARMSAQLLKPISMLISLLFQCGSRNVVLISTIFMIGFAIINKFGALFVTMPDPIIGATFFVLFGGCRLNLNLLYTLRPRLHRASYFSQSSSHFFTRAFFSQKWLHCVFHVQGEKRLFKREFYNSTFFVLFVSVFFPYLTKWRADWRCRSRTSISFGLGQYAWPSLKST